MKRLLVVGIVAIASAGILAQSQVDRLPPKPAAPRTVVAAPAAAASTPIPARSNIEPKSTQPSGGPQTPPKATALPTPEETLQAVTPPPTVGDCQYAEAEARPDCLAAVQENYRYTVAALQHRRASFEWSLTASEIMFFMVLVMVLAGLVFAAVQFKSSAPTPTDLEISTTGLKVSSSVLGVVILAMSMAFFYLYTRYVYPIQEVHHETVEASTTQ